MFTNYEVYIIDYDIRCDFYYLQIGQISMLKSIKILVGYHKKDLIYKNELLVPIHCGRAVAETASKDGKISQEEFQWLLDNTIGDNTGNNISDLNRYINEMTAIYWAWKNYDKLGNPDYIGFNHYRRYFDIPYSKLDWLLDKYDFIKTSHRKKKTTFYSAWEKGFKENEFLDQALSICKDVNSIEGDKIQKFFNGPIGNGWCNMFILPKEEFFKYCEFSILLKLPMREDRLTGMFAERLTSYYMYQLSLSKKAFSSSITNIFYYDFKDFVLEHVFSIRKNKIYNNHIVLTLFGLKIKLLCK